MSDTHADQCYATALVRCKRLLHPHEGDHIYGKPGEPMIRLTPMADNVFGYEGTVIQPDMGAERVWHCGHRHESREGAKACAAHWSGRCAKCEGCLEERVDAISGDKKWACVGNQILGPCGYSLDPDNLLADVKPSLESALRALIPQLEDTGAELLTEVLDQHARDERFAAGGNV